MKKYLLPLLLLAVVLLIPLLALFHSGFPITHDGQDHIARIANFYLDLQNGIIIPRWAPNLNWGYGHPILEFLYPLPSYIASFFHFLGFTLVDSTKILLGIGMFFSGITMYVWLSRFLSKKASFLGAALYVIAPYRFVEVYVRGDIGENLAFVFIPLVLFFIYKISKKPSLMQASLGGISLALLITAHNAISLMALPIILLYMVYCYFLMVDKKVKKLFIYKSILLIVLGFGLAAFFWIPGLLEGKFTLRNIVTKGIYKDRFVSFSQLLYGPWSYGGTGLFTVQLGVINWIVSAISLVSLPFLFKKNKKAFWYVALFLIAILAAIFIMLPSSNFIWAKVMLLQNFQFPWRFLAITVFATAALGAIALEVLPKKLQTVAFITLFAATLFFNKDYWHAKGYIYKPQSFYTSIYEGTTDTGESAPIWSVRFMGEKPKAPAQIIEGKGTITLEKRSPYVHQYSLNNSTLVRILENTLYFPGWRVLVDGVQVPVQFQDEQYRGLMTFMVPQGQHTVQVIFGESKLRVVSDVISVISFIIIIAFFGLDIIKHKKK